MQAVILAHSEPAELTQLLLCNSCALLPLKNGTMLSNLLSRFIDCDISDILVVHSASQSAALTNFIEQNRHIWPDHFNLTLHVVPSQCSVADCLSRLRSFLTADYVFLTYSTTILLDFDLRKLFMTLVRNNASVAAVFSRLPVAESKLMKAQPRELVVTSHCSEMLYAYYAASDIRKHSVLPRTLYALGKGVTARSDLHDVGCYVMSRSVVENAARIGEDVVHKRKSVWQFIDPTSLQSIPPAGDLQKADMDNVPDRSAELECFYSDISEPTGVCIFEQNGQLPCLKCDDPLIFAEANRLILQKSSIVDKESMSGKKGSSKDYSLVLSDCVVDANSSVIGSFINPGCTIGANVKILNSTLLSGVVVKDGCLIQGCVLGEGVITEKGCQLKNCAVAARQRVPDGTELESEQLGFTDLELSVSQT
ncbi:unnamed protein product [Calicophoron daubneyi]|uniref:Translation initiation factor eIF2B subunit gamma n=1 Tax=Calicophoron daubneyi TaxID=300641 RepID=A0AAV2TXU7_CALDB